MKSAAHLFSRAKRFVAALALLAAAAAPQLAAACTAGGCVMAGPRLASVSSSQGVLLNTLLGSLTGSTVSLSALDWNALAGGNVSLVQTISALQTTLGVSTPQAALNAPVSVAQIAGSASTAASQAGNTALSVALGNLAANVNVPGTIKLGDLLTSDGLVGNTGINALQLVTGAVQTYNGKNVATTPAPITVSGTNLGIPGLASSVQISAQAVEPPVYVCGPVGATFHSSALRVKLAMTLISLTPDPSLLNALVGVSGVNVTLGQMTLYIEVAEASGVITAVNALANSMTVQATPGIAAIYLGTMSDSVFFNRSHAINPATDLTPGTIGSLAINSLNVAILAKAAIVGGAPSPTTLMFSGAGVQTQGATSVAGFESSLLSSLLGNLQVTVTPSLGLLDAVVLPVLNTVVQGVVSPLLTGLASGLIDPLLGELGIGLGEVDITSGGEYLECAVSGCVFADANHNARQDGGEAGVGTALYAKLIAAATPTVASQVVAVDATTGNYAFPALNPANYTVVIGTTSSSSAVAPSGPAGWIPTTGATLSRSVAVTTADLAGQNFGLFHGSSVAGNVFKDNGLGGGNANNGVRDGGEPAIGGTPVNITDSTGATVYDSQRSDPSGAYLLWVPSTAGAGVLKVSQAADPASVFISGSAGTTAGAFAAAGAVTSFTNVVGTVYTGVNFGDVPINRLDTDGQQAAAAGTTALFAHVFHSGSGGQVSFAVAPLTAPPTGWSATTYLDANCNGQLDSGEAAATGATSVAADQALCVIVKVFVPQTAPNDTRATYTLTAAYAYANSASTSQAQRQDLTIVGVADGLKLVKTVDKDVASSGTVITYTITYVNQGSAAVSALKIRDATPAWTVLSAAGCGALPTGIAACNVTAQPAAGATGSVEWTLTGSLASGGSGTVQFSVQVQ
ncbi:MAG: hypothetical protein ABW032_02870 [Burkholderiaceae bacterium]